MRMSRSPQNGGFHRCTGGGPLREASRAVPAFASTPAWSVFCAMVAICARNNVGSSLTCRHCLRIERTAIAPCAFNDAPLATMLNVDVKAHLGEVLAGNLEEIGGTTRDASEEGEDRKRYRRHRRAPYTADHDFMCDVIIHVTEIDLEA